MTRDEIIKLAREARFEQIAGDDWVCFTEEIERFAALVAAAERERLLSTEIHSCHADCQRFACVQTRKAVREEREACIRDCDSVDVVGADDCIAAIRARGENT